MPFKDRQQRRVMNRLYEHRRSLRRRAQAIAALHHAEETGIPRTCDTCGLDKILAEFGADKTRLDGKATRCLDCLQIAHVENGKRANIQYRRVHGPRQVSEEERIRRNARNRLAGRRRREENLEDVRAKGRAATAKYRALDPERYRVAAAKCRAKNGHGYDARKRMAKINAPVNDLTRPQWEEIQAAQGHRCYYCKKRCKGHLTQDHIIPLSKGGSHTLHNVIGACQSCNSRKGNRPAPIPVQPLLLTIAPAKQRRQYVRH